MAIEIVDLPINSMVIFHSYVVKNWLVVYLPLWKKWTSDGMMTFPYGKIKAMFQTTNQKNMDTTYT